MHARQNALLCLAAAATLALASADGAFAQKINSRGASLNISDSRPSAPAGPRGGGWGQGGPGKLMANPQAIPPGGGQFIDDGAIDDAPQGPRRPPQHATRRGPNGAPPANERRLVPDEVVIEISNSVSARAIDALQRRHRLMRIESQALQLSGTTLSRWRIPDRRSVAGVVRALEADAVVASAQPNYRFTLQQDAAKTGGDSAQYDLAKLRLPQAHTVAKDDNILVAVIDSGAYGATMAETAPMTAATPRLAERVSAGAR
jgi:hypothetical protein